MDAILGRRNWIFDMDGTLTVAVHDFEAIRKALGIGPRVPILEAIDRMPEPEATEKRIRLDELECELAERSTPMPGAGELLDALHQCGARLGILTRNNQASADTTLAACGFDHYFAKGDVLHRDSCAPKPEPDGVNRLLADWRAQPSDAVVVGDYLFDLQAGRRAGTATIYIDTSARFPWSEHADISVSHLADLLPIPRCL